MNTSHFWFRCGGYSLLGHLDAPQPACGNLGVLIVPPFGWEDVCAYRPLKFMARAFSQAGMPTLRYDLPGTGDSSGDARDPGLFDSWVRSVAEASAALREAAEVNDVAVVGIHMGAMLAVAAASRGAHFRQMVLWGASVNGRKLLRELRAAANIENGRCPPQGATPQPIPGFESGGFLLSPETVEALECLDLSALPPRGSARVLLLSRDDLPHDAKLREALGAVTSVETATGRGYSAMMSTPQDSPFPAQTSQVIAEFLNRDAVGRTQAAGAPRSYRWRGQVSTLFDAKAGDTKVLESIYRVHTRPSGMFGILAEPAPTESRSDYCVLFLNPGGVRHTGPNRMWVESARRWAGRGVASLRLDLEGLGESDGAEYTPVASLYKSQTIDQIEVAIHSLRGIGMKRFITVGLCSGACWGFHSAVRNPDVRAAILVNASLLSWDPGAERRRMLRSISSGFRGWSEWIRIVRGEIHRRDVQGGARRTLERLGRRRQKDGGFLQLGFGNPAEAWSALERSQKRVTLVFREGEPLLSEMELFGHLPSVRNSWVRCVRTPDGGHTFRPLWAQALLHDLINAELGRAIVLMDSAISSSVPETKQSWVMEPDRTCATGNDL